MQVTKTRNLTNKNILLYIGVFLGALIIFYAPLAHIDHSRTNPMVIEYEEFLDQKLAVIDNQVSKIRIDYDNNKISAEEYFTFFDDLLSKREQTELENNVLLENKVDSQRVFGWKTLRIFLVGFGIRLPYLFFSIIITLLIIKIKTKDKYLKASFSLLQISCYTMALYQVIWAFWKMTDYPLDAYRTMLLVGCSLISLASVYFIMYHSRRSTLVGVLKSKIRYIMNLMIKQAVDNGHIKNEERYDDEIVYPALKKLDE